jgi:hypothetical protein
MDHNSPQSFSQRDLRKRDEQAFRKLMAQFGDRKWPSIKVLVRFSCIPTAMMNKRLRRFVANGWVRVGESDQGPWVEELAQLVGHHRKVDNDVRTSESGNERIRAGLSMEEVEERLAKLRAEREQAEKEGRPFDGSAAISKIMDS